MRVVQASDDEKEELIAGMKTYSKNAIELFHALLRSVLSTGETVSSAESEELMEEVNALAKTQGVLLMICHSIKKNKGSISNQQQQELIKGVYQYTQNEHMQKKAENVLEAAQIQYVPLKGSVIRNLYPEPWMRSSCDVDILVPEKNIEDAVQRLMEAGFRSDQKKEYHDVSLYYGETHLELHFNICENTPRIDGVLGQVWKYTEPVTEYQYRLTNEFFAFHILAHMLYHLLNGGCNIKQIVDFWLLRKNHSYDEEKLLSLLAACKLEQFYQVISEVTDDIFTGREQTELSRKIEAQILNGGLSKRKGHTDNIAIAIGGGIKKYILRSIFLPRRDMEWIYPSLRKWPVLLPYFYGKRMLSKTIGKDRKRAQDILRASKQRTDEMDLMLNELGLKE